MAKVEFELRREGIIELMQSSEMLDGIAKIANGVVASLGDGYETSPWPNGKTRVNVTIRTNNPHAYYSNLKHNTILKAVGAHKV